MWLAKTLHPPVTTCAPMQFLRFVATHFVALDFVALHFVLLQFVALYFFVCLLAQRHYTRGMSLGTDINTVAIRMTYFSTLTNDSAKAINMAM